ATAHKSALLPW
ncbi:rhs element Vgr protein, partial [Escherichia coli EC1847]